MHESGKSHRDKGQFKSLRIQSIHEKPLHESVREMHEVTGHVAPLTSCPYFITPGLTTWKPPGAS